jgi:hypothetical protein
LAAAALACGGGAGVAERPHSYTPEWWSKNAGGAGVARVTHR